MPEVACSVSNCYFWKENNRCGAEMIKIDIDKHAKDKFDTEFAWENDEGTHQDVALSTEETCCETFRPKTKSGT